MNFGNFEPLRNPAAYVSSDVLVYRYNKSGELEILTGIRQNDPWRGHITVPFGGYLDPDDINPKTAAVRESIEETGLRIEITGLIRIYGPERWHHTFGHRPHDDVFFSTPVLNVPALNRPVVTFVFAAKVAGGELNDTAEQKNLCWKKPIELVGKPLAFDHARALTDFLTTERNEGKRLFAQGVLSLIH